MKREEFTEIVRKSVEDVWYGRRSLDPVKEQTQLLVDKLYPLFESPLPPAEGASNKFRDVLNEVQRLIEINDGATGVELRAIWNNLSFAITESERRPQPTAEGAEEIIESIVESLGEPINIHNHIFEIRPYTVEHKTEWWIFHKEVGSGEPLTQWLSKFATLHAQRIAEKMVEERMKNTPKNCPKAAQCAHVKGGMKCPPNVICPI